MTKNNNNQRHDSLGQETRTFPKFLKFSNVPNIFQENTCLEVVLFHQTTVILTESDIFQNLSKKKEKNTESAAPDRRREFFRLSIFFLVEL